MPPTVKPSSETDGLLRARVGGEDRVRGVRATVGRERGHGRLQPGEDAFERQQRSDHAGREDEHLLGLQVEQPAGLGRRRDRVEQAALARGRVRDAGVDDDRLRLGGGEVLLRHDHRRRLDAVDGLHRRADGRHRRAHDGEILLLPPDARVHAGGDEALGRGDAHTSTPREPEPRRLGEPEREVRVLHRLAGGALAEVVERADDDRGAGRAVGEDADLGRVGALHARQLRCDALRQHGHGRCGRRRPRRAPRAGRRRRSAARRRSRSARGAPAAGAARSRRGSRAPARSPARAGATPTLYGETFSSTAAACDEAFRVLPAPETPDLASTMTPSGSTASTRGQSASSAAVA